ncbi:uncharacterized protein AMSG_01229 [Thecamonas trahens ATCC 50062]|uniref:Uncharacterized protein n=1 Tax=Thecamonas trahens ATCC 50062 TaxID=461836 RepID=A0A0L0DNC1_THETB|nr:hypothetical protein AMSG_01229 [Thecamonas trahens ATCC 50062]KNC53516.1 hypothetical protein AMSG_01229 [Thecamonas trahens ATCC 50062]|eukprot:XP_013761837.1 hypothetical protein AMSG_01229 [Thecamonas trahens ATCC 50062]
MARLLLALAALTLATALAAVPGPTATASLPNPISYQLHSYDDLDLWPQTLAKAPLAAPHVDALWYKIDPHYAPPEFCADQPSVTSPWAAKYGCFLLNHNPLSEARAYNSSDDVLAFIRNPAYAAYFGPAADQPVTIAWCFKIDGFAPCDGSPRAEAFLGAFGELFDALVALEIDPRFSVSFVLDGSGVPSEGATCLARFTNASLPGKPFLPATWAYDVLGSSTPLAAGFSNNASAGYDRFEVFDAAVPTPTYVAMAELGWGKFGANPWPLLVWEPSAQVVINAVAELYVAHASAGPPSGLRFAINIDPLQFALYVAPQSAVGYMGQLAPDAAAPWALLDGALVYTNPSGVVEAAPLDGHALAGPAIAAPIGVAECGRLVGAGESAALFERCMVSISTTTGMLAWGNVTALRPGPSGCQVIGGSEALLVYVCDSGASALIVDVASGAEAKFAAPTGETISAKGGGSGWRASDGGYGLVVGSASRRILMGVAMSAGTSGQLAVIGAGSRPRAAARPAGEWVVVVATDGWCWNSNEHNKATSPATCDFVPSATPNVLNYLLVPTAAESLDAILARGKVLTPCTPGVIVGSLGSGSAPAVAVTPSSEVLTLFGGLPANTPDVGSCGLPDYASGALVAQWPWRV